MRNLIIIFGSIGEASLYHVDDKTYNLIFELYKNQGIGLDAYSNMMGKIYKILEEKERKENNSVESIFLQWNSHNCFREPITFKRILQLLSE